MITFAAWTSEGQRIPTRIGSGEYRIWSRRRGHGPMLTLLHGFPTSSHDWSDVIAPLPDLDTLTFDFLGFGDSDKPADHEYSIHEQTDLVEAMWAHHQVRQTYLAVHDYAVSVGEELFARRREGRLSVDLLGAVFLNGGMYPDLHSALPAQEALLDPERGPIISQMVSEETFTASLLMTFPPDRPPSPATLHEMWCGVVNRDGHRLGYRLIKYILDRRRHAERWTTALEQTDVPRSFVWGMLDPVSGGHVVPRIRERLPACPLTCLDAIGHWPAIEDPDAVVKAIRAMIAE